MATIMRAVVARMARVIPLALMRAYLVAFRRLAFVRFVFLYFVDDDANGSDAQKCFAKVRPSLNLRRCSCTDRRNGQRCGHGQFHKPIHRLFLSDQIGNTQCRLLMNR